MRFFQIWVIGAGVCGWLRLRISSTYDCGWRKLDVYGWVDSAMHCARIGRSALGEIEGLAEPVGERGFYLVGVNEFEEVAISYFVGGA
jgi:hypothetical protein